MPSGDPRKLVRTGDDLFIPAAAYNRWQRSADYAESQQRGGSGGPSKVPPLSQITVQVKNTTEALIDMGGVVGLNTLIIEPADDKKTTELMFEVAAPTADNITRRQFAILTEPSEPGRGSVAAYVSGIFPALVNMSSDGGAFARVEADVSDSLVGGAYGEYRILWVAEGTGEQWALVTPCDADGPFVVYLTKDGGANGTQTAAATYTYTLKDAAGTTLAEALTPARVRPFGKITFAATGTRGLAVYEDGTLILLDAYGEFPGSGGCT